MPYPIVHVIFFIFCISLPGLYGFFISYIKHRLNFKDWIKMIFLILIGSIGSLLPDVPFVWNFLLYRSNAHISVFSIPTHSLFFSITAIITGFCVGYIIYRKLNKAVYISMFVESAFLSHLLLDDIAWGRIEYLYPIYKENISIFSYIDVEFAKVDVFYYTIAGTIAVFFLFCILLMNLMALHGLGFKLEYDEQNI